MINSIVFSKDRAAQLDLLLKSIEKNGKDVFQIKVIYASSEIAFEKGYEKLIDKYPEVKWMKESTSFKSDVMSAIENTESEYTCFFTDNDIIYRKVNEGDLTSKLKEDKDAFCFSTRLGKNTVKCYTMNADNVIKPHHEDDKFICWNWQLHYLDFGYPLSLDGHVFRSKEIKKLSKKVSFDNPSDYESGLQMFDNFPRKNMWAYKESVLVNSPYNVAQDTYDNINGEQFSASSKELNIAFLSGQEIDYNKIDFSNIEGCSQELELPLTELEFTQD